jgi:hypothetical protein
MNTTPARNKQPSLTPTISATSLATTLLGDRTLEKKGTATMSFVYDAAEIEASARTTTAPLPTTRLTR